MLCELSDALPPSLSLFFVLLFFLVTDFSLSASLLWLELFYAISAAVDTCCGVPLPFCLSFVPSFLVFSYFFFPFLSLRSQFESV